MSAAARKRIGEATKKRWAVFRAKKAAKNRAGKKVAPARTKAAVA